MYWSSNDTRKHVTFSCRRWWTLLITDSFQQGLSWRGQEVCGPKLLSSLFWAGAGACALCMCCCLIIAVGSGNQEWFFCSPCKAKKNRSLKGVGNLSSCCYGQCYCIVLFLSLRNVSSRVCLRADEPLHVTTLLTCNFLLLSWPQPALGGLRSSCQTAVLLHQQGQRPSIRSLWCFPSDYCPLW